MDTPNPETIEIGPAAVVELSELAAAAARAPMVLHASEADRAAWAAICDWARASHELVEMAGGCDEQAEELAADLMLELEKRDEDVAELRRDLALERAARELAERLAERRLREIHRLERELALARRGFRETYSREEGAR